MTGPQAVACLTTGATAGVLLLGLGTLRAAVRARRRPDVMHYPIGLDAETIDHLNQKDANMSVPARPLAQRFWSKVQKTDTCWLWTGYRDVKGYGQIHVAAGTHRWAHRVSYELNNGAIPPGMCVCHHCDNPACVRPDHLFLGTVADNNRDMAAKGRHGAQQHPELWAGERNASTKLCEMQVLEIRRRFAQGGITKAALAREYGVSETTIWDIIARTSWGHLDDPMLADAARHEQRRLDEARARRLWPDTMPIAPLGWDAQPRTKEYEL